MTTESTMNAIKPGRSVALWAGVIGAPAAWAVQLEIGYALAPWTCKSQNYFVPHLVTAIFVLLALIGAALSYRDWKLAGRGSPEETDGGPIARTRFLGALGLLLSLLSAMVILAQGIASFFFNGCWT
jgi:hypothetical protein